MTTNGHNLLPSHRNARIQIVEFGSTECNLFILFSISCLHFQLHQLLFYPLYRFLLALHCPTEKADNAIQACKQDSRQEGREKKSTLLNL